MSRAGVLMNSQNVHATWSFRLRVVIGTTVTLPLPPVLPHTLKVHSTQTLLALDPVGSHRICVSVYSSHLEGL